MQLKPHLRWRGMRTRRAVTLTLWQNIKHAAVLIALLLGLLYAIEKFTLEVVVDEIAAQRDKVEATWISCLNHHGAWVNGELHICTLANTWIRREEK